jgi:hypothetical protein
VKKLHHKIYPTAEKKKKSLEEKPLKEFSFTPGFLNPKTLQNTNPQNT